MSGSDAGRVLRRPEPRPSVETRETRARVGASGLLRITVRRGADRDVVALAGEVDVATAPEIASTIHRLLSGGRTDILIDQGAVTYMDGAALRALITATFDAAHAGGSLWVTENTLCSRLLAITGETHRLNITAGPIAQAFLGERASEWAP